MTALQIALLCSILVALVAFGLSALFFVWVKKRPSQNETIEKISKLIANGANTFLKKEYTVLAIFAAVAAIIILLFLPKPIWQANALDNVYMMLSYICGTVFSAIAGKIGIMIATIANKKTAEAAKISTAKAFMTGYRGGAVMGMAVVGASLIGVSAIFWIFSDASMLLGFSFGASSLALFAKAGGGIFTKTADISADLVGKVELGLPEDDPRNPAVIADNVGDNVGDVAGMGADLFDSNVASLAAALVISSSIDNTAGTLFTPVVFVYALVGLLASIIGVAFNRMGKKGNPTSALNFSTYVTMILFASLTAVATAVFFNNEIYWRVYGAAVIGLAVGAVIGIATDYFTDDRRRPVKKVASASGKGPAFTVLSGISYSFYSTLPAMAGIAISALASYKLCEPIATSIGLSSDKSTYYIKTMMDSVFAFSTSGSEPRKIWAANAGYGYEIAPTPITVAAGEGAEGSDLVFIPTDKGNIVALNGNDGSIAWKHKLSGALINYIQPIEGRKILVSTMDGIVALLKY